MKLNQETGASGSWYSAGVALSRIILQSLRCPMRSIRRSMTVYMLVLLAATLGVVWVVIDQVTARALAAREAAGGEQDQCQLSGDAAE